MKTKHQKKNLRKKLSAIVTIYMDAIEEKKKKRFKKYLDSKLKDVVDYYMLLQKKKKRKNKPVELVAATYAAGEMNSTDNNYIVPETGNNSEDASQQNDSANLVLESTSMEFEENTPVER